ncbi:MAG: NB-ARC domain-containing protein [Chloroflexota bacterium]
MMNNRKNISEISITDYEAPTLIEKSLATLLSIAPAATLAKAPALAVTSVIGNATYEVVKTIIKTGIKYHSASENEKNRIIERAVTPEHKQEALNIAYAVKDGVDCLLKHEKGNLPNKTQESSFVAAFSDLMTTEKILDTMVVGLYSQPNLDKEQYEEVEEAVYELAKQNGSLRGLVREGYYDNKKRFSEMFKSYVAGFYNSGTKQTIEGNSVEAFNKMLLARIGTTNKIVSEIKADVNNIKEYLSSNRQSDVVWPINIGVSGNLESFVGRLKEIETVIEKIMNPARTAIVGPGGMGKTSLVKKITQDKRIIDEFKDGIIWLSLGPEANDETVINNFQILAKKLKLETDAITNIRDLQRLISADIQSDRSILVIIDDVWNPDLAEKQTLTSNGIKHLITTRDKSTARTFSNNINIIELSQVDDDTAYEILQNYVQNENVFDLFPELMKHLRDKLGGMPLALQIAGSHIRNNFDAIFGMNEVAVKEAIPHTGTTLTTQVSKFGFSDQKVTLEQVVQFSIENIENEKVKEAMYLLAALAPEPADFDFDMAKAIVKEDAKETIRYLKNKSLINVDTTTARISIHQIVHDVISLELDKRQQEIANINAIKGTHTLSTREQGIEDLARYIIEKLKEERAKYPITENYTRVYSEYHYWMVSNHTNRELDEIFRILQSESDTFSSRYYNVSGDELVGILETKVNNFSGEEWDKYNQCMKLAELRSEYFSMANLVQSPYNSQIIHLLRYLDANRKTELIDNVFVSNSHLGPFPTLKELGEVAVNQAYYIVGRGIMRMV